LFDSLVAQVAQRLNGELVAAPAPFPEYVDDPAGFCRDVLGVNLWSAQRQVAESVRDHRRTTVRACHEVGKSYLAACLACWWISTRPVGDAFVLSTAPTGDQVRAILWRYMNELHARGALPGKVNQREWTIDRRLVGMGRKPSEHNPSAMQGIHALHVFVIIDEANGVPGPLWTAVDTLTANDFGRQLAIGNPDDPQSYFATTHKPGSGWHQLRISAFDAPAFTGEEVSARLAQLLVSKTWVEERRRGWTEQSPLWAAKVLGEFPDVNSDGVIPWNWIRDAQQRAVDPAALAGLPWELGADIGGGGDFSVVAARRGPVVRIVHQSQHVDTMRTAGEIVQVLAASGATVAKLDVIGIGRGVVDRLREMEKPAVGVNVGLPATTDKARERFANLKAELWWGLRERFEAGDIVLDPADGETAAQLATVKYSLNSRGQIMIEGMKELKARGQASPDRADAVVLAFAPRPLSSMAAVVKVRGA
jgi:hypothetical protein